MSVDPEGATLSSVKGCLCSEFVQATEAAALAAGPWMGQGDGAGGRAAATGAMRGALDGLPITGTIVVGKGRQGGEQQLLVGQVVGAGGARCDLAVDALEGTDCLARGQGGAMAVLAAGDPGNIMSAPEMYMQKLVVGAQANGVINIDRSVADNLRAIAAAYGRTIGEITAVILDRSRHEDLIAEIRGAGARIKLISDGDISAGISASVRGTGTQVYVGIGGAAEGVITAAALLPLGGEIQVRFWPLSRREIEQARQLGIEDIEARLSTRDMVRGDVVFVATGVTGGEFVRGIRYFHEGARTHTLLMCTRCRMVRFIDSIHLFSDERREIRL
jgi:fructose-1,6-bisphosphatase II